MTSHFAGTIFRFPLRTEELASKSKISKKPVSISDIEVLFEEFKQQLSEILLFLKNVESIEFYRYETTKEVRDMSPSLHVTAIVLIVITTASPPSSAPP